MISNFGFRICFGFRISGFGFHRNLLFAGEGLKSHLTHNRMKTLINNHRHLAGSLHALLGAMGLALVTIVTNPARADETCSSPYLARIEGQEEFVYVWTLGVEGLGDGSDKLVVVDVKPGSPTYGKVIHSHSVGGRHEAHHGGFTDDRRQLWLSGLETSKIFIFDVHSQSREAAST